LEKYLAQGGDASIKPNFHEDVMIMAFQRNLKAWGRFEYLQRVKGKSLYMSYVPNLIMNVGKMLKQQPALEPLNQLIPKYEPRLQEGVM